MAFTDLTDLTGRAQRLPGQLRDMVWTLRTSPRELVLVLVALAAFLLAAGGNHLPDAITNPFDDTLIPILDEG